MYGFSSNQTSFTVITLSDEAARDMIADYARARRLNHVTVIWTGTHAGWNSTYQQVNLRTTTSATTTDIGNW